jgi:hypothetical protein
MYNNVKVVLVSLFLFLLFFAGRTMDEGMWLLDTVNKLPLEPMKGHGLALTPEQIYSESSASVSNAIILLGGGTASFISAEGLILTNHHVAFGGIQSLSSVQDDYLKSGFVAKIRAEELSTTYTAQVMIGMKDVTPEVRAALNDTMTAEQRAKAVRTVSGEIQKKAKGTTDRVCRVSEMFSGVKYYLFTYEPIDDIRLVYAPPSAIGNYGAEVDNWIWPRHTGDFSIMRAYVGKDGAAAKYSRENVPYAPKTFLPFSTHGVEDGSFAMIMGYPGRTSRYMEASGVQLARDITLPTTIRLNKIRMDIIQAAGKRDRAVEIQYAGKYRGIANVYKKYLGTLEGMRRSDLIPRKHKEEEEFSVFVKATPARKAAYGSLLADLEHPTADLATFTRTSLLLSSVTAGVDLVRLANRFRVFAEIPPDSVTEKDLAPLRTMVTSVFKNFDLAVEKQTLVALILASADLSSPEQPGVFRSITREKSGAAREEAAREFVDDLYDETLLTTPGGCEALLGKGPSKIMDDDYVQFAARIDAEQALLTARSATLNQRLSQLRAKFVEAWLAWKKEALVYPDANRTLRFAYGTVQPFSPRDAVEYFSQTTLGGVMEKETGEDPFIVPPRLKELWQKRDFGRYADPKRGDVPVAFITDLDITGGNSGSPVINGKGELIGCAFDGNWESLVGDYLFQERYNRTISVDARYILFVLDKFSGAENVLKELEVR